MLNRIMELLQSEEENDNAAFELPGIGEAEGDGGVSPELNSGVTEPQPEKELSDPEFDLPEVNIAGFCGFRI